MSLAPLEKLELFARLAGGHAARIAVVTPNRRLSQALAADFDRFQIGKGLGVWESADILPFSAFAERAWEQLLYSEAGADLPLLLSSAQERALWEQAIEASGWRGQLLSAGEAAAEAMRAWRLAHAWRIAGALGAFPGSDDARAFAAWARDYEKRARGQIDAARLPDLAAHRLAKQPALLVAYAFDILPPQTREFFQACESDGIEVLACQPDRVESNPRRIPLQSARYEIEAAARWARARLEAGSARIGVVVPDLEKRRKEVVRVFSRVMRPAYNLPGAKREPVPFNVSLGEPLAAYPLVNAALSMLEFAFREISFAQASRLVRSPFLGGAEAEMGARARFDSMLGKKSDPTVSLPKLIASIEGCPALRQLLEEVFALGKEIPSGRQSPHDWARHFTALLEAAGFPGERALDSEEFQARAKWHETLAEFAKLGRIADEMDFRHAWSKLEQICRETPFQPAHFQDGADAPIQVLGVLESAGLEFDRLWVSGLTEEAWPLPARHNPFIPVALQKKAGIPEAAAETSLALDRRITEGWTRAAREVVFSHPLKEEDRDLVPSPLISSFGTGKLELLEYGRYRDALFAVRRSETAPDGQAPPIATPQVRGGTRVLADQAACPFRAFARHRLGAEPLEAPAPGLDAADRGKLLHELMKGIWGELKSWSSLDKDVEPAIRKAAASAVRALELQGRFAELEQARLAKLAREWLEVEKARAEFAVIHVETRIPIAIGGLELSGRIDRLDRLSGGTHALIDYKTSYRLSPRDWLGPRPDDPQLPLYALSAAQDIGAVAFARLRAGEMRFMGFSRQADALPGVRKAESWENLLKSWKKELEALAGGYASGEARVDPKRGLDTCRNCGLQPLCRVYERIDALAGEGDGEGGE